MKRRPGTLRSACASARRWPHPIQIAAQSELLAGEHDGRPVLAHGAAHEDAVARTHPIESEADAKRPESDPRGRQVYAVAVAAAHDLGVAGNDRDAAAARRIGEPRDHPPQQRDFQSFLEEYAQCHEVRIGAAHRQIVHGAMHGERANVAAREFERLDRKAIRGDHELAIARHRQRHRVGARIKIRICERGREQLLDQLAHQPTAVAVRESDMGITKFQVCSSDAAMVSVS